MFVLFCQLAVDLSVACVFALELVLVFIYLILFCILVILFLIVFLLCQHEFEI